MNSLDTAHELSQLRDKEKADRASEIINGISTKIDAILEQASAEWAALSPREKKNMGAGMIGTIVCAARESIVDLYRDSPVYTEDVSGIIYPLLLKVAEHELGRITSKPAPPAPRQSARSARGKGKGSRN